jgi:hypothetical protein
MRVKDLNAARDEIKKLRDKVSADLKSLGVLCATMGDEVNRRYHEEVSQADGSTEGLEDFETVTRILKRDRQAVLGALAIIQNKVQGAQGYNFEEMTEEAAERAAESEKGK